MGLNIQIVVDAARPHELADWWAETLQWAVEPQDADFIRSMISQGYATEDQTMTHRGNLVWKDGAAIRPAEDIESKAPERRILFQRAPEGKTVKNRVHWDVRLDGRDKDEVRRELEARGASFLWSARQGPHSWHTMA
ncbi:MAG: VOC family protein, partial [Actinomycetes bacterium]